MPEGPSIVILKEKLLPFKNKTVVEASGYAPVDLVRLKGKKIFDIRTWGKHTLICFKDFTLRIHLMMFGSYTINEDKKFNPKISLRFKKDILNFYLCQVTFLSEPLDELYDWSVDIMSDAWDPAAAAVTLKKMPDAMICDALLDQAIFAGSGNIIKNEVLYRVKLNPEILIGKISPLKRKALLKEMRIYAFDFLKWRKENTLSRHWEAYEQKICKRCSGKIIKKLTGKTKRQSYFCENCQAPGKK